MKVCTPPISVKKDKYEVWRFEMFPTHRLHVIIGALPSTATAYQPDLPTGGKKSKIYPKILTISTLKVFYVSYSIVYPPDLPDI